MKKNNKGITLIALIVTIIVLLILAGITVASLSGDNGLIDKTSEAQFRTEIAQYQEDLDLSIIKEEGKNKRGRTNKFNATSYDDIKKIIPSFHKKYENSLVIEEDKLVFKGNNRDLYKLSYEMGLISSDDLLDDEILEELQPFITEWTVEAGDTITLPISGTCDFTVNYGDGTEVKISNSGDSNKRHTYTNAGTYTVTIKGKCTQFTFNYISDAVTRSKITKIVQFGSTGFTSLTFMNCSNLKGPIPEPSKNSFINMTSMSELFLGCTNLNGEIPEKLFYNCPNVNSFYGVFRKCSLTGSIPENLFKKCPEVTKFSYAFMECSGLTGEIPENLFSNNLKVKSFGNLFRVCKNLSGSIPEKLFENHIEVVDIGGVFCQCSGLTGNIPENLFKDCTKITSVNDMFVGCAGLTGSIPAKLFDNNTLISSFYATFNGCTKLTGNAPALWNRTNALTGNLCFSNCRNLSNYNQIPKAWGGGGE